MNWVRNLLLVIVGLPLLVASYVWWSERPTVGRFEVTLTVDVNGQPRRGSAVWEVASFRNVGPGGPYGTRQKAEGVCVDVGQGLLCMLLAERPRTTTVVSEVNPTGFILTHYRKANPAIPRENPVATLAAANGSNAVIQVDPADWPMMVLFSDPTEYLSIAIMDLAEEQKLEATAVQVRTVTIQATQKPVTSRLRNQLPWIVAYEKAESLNQATTKYGASLALDGSDRKYTSPSYPIRSNLNLTNFLRVR